MNKKIVTHKLPVLLLALVMVLSLLPMTAFAADDRAPITEVEATYTFPELAYGDLSYPTNVSIEGNFITKGSSANIAALGIRDAEGNACVGALKEGTYRYRCQLRTDNNTHVLTDNTTLKINGESWTSTSDVHVGDGFSYKWFLGPTVTIVKPVEVPLTVPTSPVPIKEGMLFDGDTITELDASKYVSGGEGTLTFSKKSGPLWANVSSAGMVGGTATTVGVTDPLVITVTDGETSADFTVSIPQVYPLPENRTPITEVEAIYTFPELVSGSSSYPTNDSIAGTSITKGSPASISTLGIRDAEGNPYEGVLKEGTYCYRCQLRTDSYTHVLTDNTTLKINGVIWTSSPGVSVGNGYSYDWFTSPTFTIEKPADAPTLLEGNNGKYTKGSTTGLTFKSSAALDDLVSVSVDDGAIDESKYTKTSGSTIITLKPEYLDTLSVGGHTLTITSNTGAVTANFTVVANSTTSPDDDTLTQPGEHATETGASVDSSTPQTGDNSNTLLWVALMLVAGIGVVATTIIDKNRRYNR